VQFDQVDAAMKRFRLDIKRWPTEEEGIAVLWNREALEDEDEQSRWRGPYLEQPVTEDKWGSALVYRNPSEDLGEGFYDLVSFGPDREEGTEDDITNHDRLRDEDGEIGDSFDDFTPPDVEEPAGGAPGS
jgi:general secretion pathway protein G